MQIPQLRMQQTYAQLGLNITKPVQEIEQPRAELNLKQEPAILEIRQPQGTLTIDTTEARANIDLKSPLRRSREFAEFGYQQAMEAIARISSEGDQLAAIQNKGNPIAEIAFQDSGIYENTDIIAEATAPDNGVDIHYEAHPAEINWTVRGKTMDPVIHKPIHNYTPGKVEGYIKQWNSLTIDVVGTGLDVSV